MAGVEQPCYTLINFPTDSDPYNEMQLKLDLGKTCFYTTEVGKLFLVYLGTQCCVSNLISNVSHECKNTANLCNA